MIALSELERELQTMKPRSQVFELVKAEMKRRGHWKNKSRGRVFVTGQDERRLPLVRRESGRSEGDN